jgi:hypothetical protein
VKLSKEDGWDYLEDGVYYRFESTFGDVELVCYDGLVIYERIVIDGPSFRRLIKKYKEFADG